VLIEHDGRRIIDIKGDPDHPANFGRLCTKGSTLHYTATDVQDRLLYPQLRTGRDSPRQQVSWDQAMAWSASRFADIIAAHGPDAVAFYISGQLLTEDYYVFNKLAKGVIGTNNVDTNSRLCMSSAVAGYKVTLGMDSPPCSYRDIDHAATLFITGSNTAYAHPILYRRIEDARAARPGMKLIVVDPRRTDTARDADLHLPILPGTDVALYHAMLHVLLWEERIDRAYIAAHTVGFEALRERVREYSPRMVAGICGVPEADIVTAARWFAEGPTLSLYCQGLNQSCHGTDKNATLINLHLATGQIGKPGAGPFSLTGQPNAMGGREVGGMANLLSAHRDLANPEHRAEIAALWGVDSVPAQPGKTAVELFEAIHRGEIKALWVACTNPAHSLPNQTQVREALKKLDFLVVQDSYLASETVPYADLLLPAATWGEREGTVTNSERRITRVHAAVPPPGEARADWAIAADFGRRLAACLGKPGEALMPYRRAQDVFDEHARSTAGRDLDITGLDYALLDRDGPQQWPYPAGATGGRERLYEDGVFPTADGRARFVAPDYLATAENIDARYSLRLTTGRLRDQWHTLTRSGRAARLWMHVEEPLLSMHTQDMARRGLANDDLVWVKSRRGKLCVKVRDSDEVRPGQAFLPMHWGGSNMAGLGINVLTHPATDPVSRQPELKHAAIQVEKADLPWQLAVLISGDVLAAQASLRPWLARFDYASLGLYGRDTPLVILRAACSVPLDAAALAELDRIAGTADPGSVLAYDDARRGISKRARIEAGRIVAVRLSGEAQASAWLKDWMADNQDAQSLRTWLLAPIATPPAGSHNRGRVICNCLNVTAPEIERQISVGCDLTGLQTALKCGTQCGSCVPELKKMLAAGTRQAA
jgi:assimilatory nitrate reductase catalytic subunit